MKSICLPLAIMLLMIACGRDKKIEITGIVFDENNGSFLYPASVEISRFSCKFVVIKITRQYRLERGRTFTAEFVRSICKRTCEITKRLIGQRNFPHSTLPMLSSFFGLPIITVG